MIILLKSVRLPETSMLMLSNSTKPSRFQIISVRILACLVGAVSACSSSDRPQEPLATSASPEPPDTYPYLLQRQQDSAGGFNVELIGELEISARNCIAVKGNVIVASPAAEVISETEVFFPGLGVKRVGTTIRMMGGYQSYDSVAEIPTQFRKCISSINLNNVFLLNDS